MNKLIIEGKEADLKADERIKLTRQVNDLREVKNKRTDFTNQFTLPYTPANNKIFEHVRVYSSTSTTPYRYLDCQLLLNGYPVTIEGKIVLDKTDKRGYRVTVYAGLFNLFDELKNKKLSELDLSEYSHFITLSEVTSRNSNNTNIFYPLFNDGYGINGNVNIKNLFPFIKNSVLVSKMFNGIGFNVAGDFLNTDNIQNTCVCLNDEKKENSFLETNITETNINSPNDRDSGTYLMAICGDKINSKNITVSNIDLENSVGVIEDTSNTIIPSNNFNEIVIEFNNVVASINSYQAITGSVIISLYAFFGDSIKTVKDSKGLNYYPSATSLISNVVNFESTDITSINGDVPSFLPATDILVIYDGSNLTSDAQKFGFTGQYNQIGTDDFITINFPKRIKVKSKPNKKLGLVLQYNGGVFFEGIEGNITGDSIKYIYNGSITQNISLDPKTNIDLSQTDLLKANLQLTNSFVSNIDYITKEVEITTLDSVANNTPYDWSNKLTEKGQTLIKYETNKVGQSSYFKYENEDNETIGQNIIDISNTRLDSEKDIIESDIKAVDQSSITLDSNSFTVDTIYTFEDKDEVNDNLIEEETLSGQDLINHQNEYRAEVNTEDLFITYFENQAGNITYEDENGNTSTRSSFPKTNFTKLHWSKLNNQYYQTWKEIFDEYKEVEMFFNLTLQDVIDFDFKRPVYLDTELGASLFYMNKISNYIEGKPTKCTLIKI